MKESASRSEERQSLLMTRRRLAQCLSGTVCLFGVLCAGSTLAECIHQAIVKPYAYIPSGYTAGVVGTSASPKGTGVSGVNNATTGGNGVAGIANATSGSPNGVYGQINATSGAGVNGPKPVPSSTISSPFAAGASVVIADPSW